jgi:hypothetical protein
MAACLPVGSGVQIVWDYTFQSQSQSQSQCVGAPNPKSLQGCQSESETLIMALQDWVSGEQAHLEQLQALVCVCSFGDLNWRPTPWATPPAISCDRFFQDRVLGTICPSWFWTLILLISASWVARIIGVSHQLYNKHFIPLCADPSPSFSLAK